MGNAWNKLYTLRLYRFSHGNPEDNDLTKICDQLQVTSISSNSSSSSSKSKPLQTSTSWAEAPEFVPRCQYPTPTAPLRGTEEPSENAPPRKSNLCLLKPKSSSYCMSPIVRTDNSENATKSWAEVVNPDAMEKLTVDQAESQICPWQMMGECRYGKNCAYVHGLTCDMCGQPILHPYHSDQRKQHTKVLAILDLRLRRTVH